MTPTIHELSALSAVATHRSFRRAASVLNISPSSLSHAVASVERQLGIRIFNRTTRSVSLTEAGAAFLRRVEPALAVIAEAVETVNQFRDTPAGLLRLNGSEGAFERVLPLILTFMQRYPDMRVDMVSEGRMIDIVAEGFDAGLRLAEAVPQEMVSIPIGESEEFAVVATPDYFARHGKPKVPGDLFAHECLRSRMASGSVSRWEFECRGEELRLDPPGRLMMGSHDLTLRAARAGAGIAYVTYRAAADDLKTNRLVRVLADWTPAFPGICLYYPRQKLPSAGLKAFIAHCRTAQRRGQKSRSA
jgi:DNA-binding transcriptional LysR family regulator